MGESAGAQCLILDVSQGVLGEVKFDDCPSPRCWASSDPSSDFMAQRTGDTRILFSLPA